LEMQRGEKNPQAGMAGPAFQSGLHGGLVTLRKKVSTPQRSPYHPLHLGKLKPLGLSYGIPATTSISCSAQATLLHNTWWAGPASGAQGPPQVWLLLTLCCAQALLRPWVRLGSLLPLCSLKSFLPVGGAGPPGFHQAKTSI
jgi:hypothetical protein